VTDFDRKELIVPNKEFITGRVLNWTLSDQLNRVVINVGVAYGSDVSQARHLILAAAEDHPEILKDPAPAVTFNAFGDSALNLVLFAWLPNLDNRLEVIHDLHTMIHERLNDAGISMAYPQRDVHLHALHPLEVRVVHAESQVPSNVPFRTEKKAV
jgi:potassium efflux system protein